MSQMTDVTYYVARLSKGQQGAMDQIVCSATITLPRNDIRPP
ncbi:hypothetical protein QA641_14870 [Bradyrhizobium sp. CB1650]|nr:hypothetical protein [Bradyrhizobium sp. CB1650]WGD55064.1 hypothetical protein QA641_14870 [Bradyrhizobium sp. CB1650]